MPQQEYIKHLYEKEDFSVNKISQAMGINWRTANKYAKNEDWNKIVKPKQKRRRPVMETFTETVDVWILEDQLLPRKERRPATAMWKRLREKHGFTGSERTVRAYVSERKKELKIGQEEQYLELEHPIGEAQADFGMTHVIWDGEFKEICSLTTAYPFSNGGFTVPLPGENTLCFLYGLRLIFEMSGGVPRKIRFDNLSAAVVSIGKNGQRTLCEHFVRFMLHYRFEAEFCNPGKGNEKGCGENKVGYTRRNWYLPYPEAEGFEALTLELHQRAIDDLERPHYAKGTQMSTLWAEEQKALLPLPREPFEPVEFKNVRVNKYGKVKVDTESYELPNERVGSAILAKIWWDKVELLDHNQQCLATFPRPYTLKPKPIDWQGHFAIFVRKPNGAKNSSLYRFLPPVVLNYLEADPEIYRDRLKFVYVLLKEGYAIDFIAQVLSKATGTQIKDQALIWHLIYQLSSQECPPAAIGDDHSPLSVRHYLPQVEDYDQLMPQAKGGEKGAEYLAATV
jgi:transposase